MGLAVASEFPRQMGVSATQANHKNSSDMDRPTEGCSQPPAGGRSHSSQSRVCGYQRDGSSSEETGTSGAHCGAAVGTCSLSGCPLVSSQLQCKCDVK